MRACQIIINAVGFKKAIEILKALGGEKHYIPERVPKELLKPVALEMLKSGTYAEVATELEISERTVRRYHEEEKIKKNLPKRN